MKRWHDQRGADSGRPEHVAASGHVPIPAIDDELCLEASGAVRLQLGGTSLDVEPSCPDAPGVSIAAATSGVDLFGQMGGAG
jgi:hypothetical protein